MAKVELQATGCAGGSSRICPSISICEPPRSDRKRGLAKLRLDDGLLRGCRTRAGRQLQDCGALAIAQARDYRRAAECSQQFPPSDDGGARSSPNARGGSACS
jgi:hypothetical protein